MSSVICTAKKIEYLYNKDPIAQFLEDEQQIFLEALFLSEISMPPIAKTMKYRMLMPDFFNYAISDFFGHEILRITEHEGESYDWVMFRKKISLKLMHNEPFPRFYKKNPNKMTKPSPIQLKNTIGSVDYINNEFDYLLITVVTNETGYGIYLLSNDKVRDLLKESYKYNNKCDENGYDGKGQFKLYIQEKEECLSYIEMNNDDDMLRYLKNKYNYGISGETRSYHLIEDLERAIGKQINLSKKE